MPDRGVCYFLWGTGHAIQLLVSAWSLRRHWDGPVTILTPDHAQQAVCEIRLSEPIPCRIAADKRLDMTVTPMPLCTHRRHTANVTKTWMHRYTPFERTVFLDADTFIPKNVVNPLDALWPSAAEQVVWTQFSDWRTLSSPYEARIMRAEKHLEKTRWMQPYLECLVKNEKAVNNGVYGFLRIAECFEQIHELTKIIWPIFIPDEVAVQILYAKYPHRLIDCRWNQSPRHYRNIEDTKIFHCHGSKHLHRTTQKAWLAEFRQVWESNLAGVQSWPETRNECAKYLEMLREK